MGRARIVRGSISSLDVLKKLWNRSDFPHLWLRWQMDELSSFDHDHAQCNKGNWRQRGLTHRAPQWRDNFIMSLKYLAHFSLKCHGFYSMLCRLFKNCFWPQMTLRLRWTVLWGWRTNVMVQPVLLYIPCGLLTPSVSCGTFLCLRYEIIIVPCCSWLIPFPLIFGFHIFFTTHAQ